ncbi:MAG: bifunctional serine/threonine-protein kinase/formylglycine-generating enzyme family protein [Betaproteobacteria bacterium]
MATDARALPLGTILAGYRIDRILGQGGFGITYLATDAKLMRQVAIKEYYPREYASRDRTMTIRASGDSDDKEIFESGLRRFLQEGQLLARFEHPNIVAVRRFFEAHGTAYLVMDYCDGRPLDEIIKNKGLTTQDELERIWFPLLSGLEQVHKAGFLHRDIKPANIFMRTDGSPLLLDFGSAITTNTQFTRGVTTLVADGYSPIEQYDSNGKQGPYTDVYGLASTLYRVVTGERPQVSTGRILDDNVKPSSAVARGRYTSNLLGAIDAGMAIRPEKRPQSVAEWRSLINAKPRPAPPPKVNKQEKLEPKYEIQPAVVDTLKTEQGSGTLGNNRLETPHPTMGKLSTLTKLLLVLVAIGFFFALFSYKFRRPNTGGNETSYPVVLKGDPAPTPVESQLELQDCANCPVMRLVQGGSFSMGSSNNELLHDTTEQPQHLVNLGSFYAGKFEVTQKEWNACVAAKGCQGNRNNQGEAQDELPVIQVSWYDAQAYVSWLSKHTGKDYRLMTESEWEFSARGGNESAYHFGTDSSKLDNFAWYEGNSDGQPHRVGGKNFNQYGLYDIYGNVAEWTSDCWNDSYVGAPKDATPWKAGNCKVRVLRGGSWEDDPANMRSASRKFGIAELGNPSVGFRVARKPD